MPTGLHFELRPPEARSSPTRADVACFVGLGTPRPGPALRAALAELRAGGWSHLVNAGASVLPCPLPLRVESAAAFDALFERIVRTADGLSWEAPLAGAVRDFFRQGGQRAWVLAVAPAGTPPTNAGAAARKLGKLIPGVAGSRPSDPADRERWRGLGHLAGLPEVAFACLPDLPYLFGGDAEKPPAADEPEGLPPQFVECTNPPPEPLPVRVFHAPPLPRLDDGQLRRWADTLGAARAVLGSHRRDDVQLLAAVPLGARGSTLTTDPLAALLHAGAFESWRTGGAGSASIQLAWPWLAGGAGADRVGALAPPDGALAGLLARNALRKGTFRAATGSDVLGVRRLEPVPRARAVRLPRPASPGSALGLSLDQRVCLLGSTPGGLRLLSDVTTSADPLWRFGGPARLSGALRRHLLRAGEPYVFEPAGPRTRTALARELSAALDQVVRAGGIAPGPAGEPAYTVRCDGSTHTQADLDAGRLVVEITVRPVATIEAITVVLTLGDGVLSASEAE